MTHHDAEDPTLRIQAESERMIAEAERLHERFDELYRSAGLKREDLANVKQTVERAKQQLTPLERERIDREEAQWREELERDVQLARQQVSVGAAPNLTRLRSRAVRV